MGRQSELFPTPPAASVGEHAPLAERMRPRTFDEFHGQRHLIGAGRLLRVMVDQRRLESLILWGPPGCGKTTLARLLAAHHAGPVARFSAVLHGVRELRALVTDARRGLEREHAPTLVLVDEIHRFHKGQQDAFLPHVEGGTIVLLGMTTENPAFEIVPPLLSRTHVVVLEPLAPEEVEMVVLTALADTDRGLGAAGLTLDAPARDALVALAHGDARVALGVLEAAAALVGDGGRSHIDREAVREAAQHRPLAHDKTGDAHYDVLSAFIKSMRGSDADASVYWLMRLLEAGEDPLLVARRMVIFAAEDVGLANPDALPLAVAAKEAVHFVGLPEGRIPLASAAIHLACSPKSNAAYTAMRAASEAIRSAGALPVPAHLRNAPTGLARALGHGRGYEYAHDDPEALVAQTHLPTELVGRVFYEPTDRGWEGTRRAFLAEARRRRTR